MFLIFNIKYLRFVFLSTTIIILWSCSKYSVQVNRTDLNEVEIEVLKPAEIIIPQHINKVLITYYDDLANYTIFKETSHNGRFADTLNHFPLDVVINDLINQINLSQRLKTSPETIIPFTRNFHDSNNWQKIDSIGEANKSEAILIIDSVSSLFIHSVNKTRLYDEYNANTCMNTYLSKVRFILFDIATHTQFDAITFNNNAFSKTCDIPDNIKQEDFGYMDNILNDVCVKYIKHVSPVWIKTNRKYYGWGNLEMQKAKEYVMKNDWQNAKASWEKLLNVKNKTLANHATYNLALAYEMLGDLDKAYEYVCKAYMENQNSITNDYYEILVNRLEDRKTLNKQLYYK